MSPNTVYYGDRNKQGPEPRTPLQQRLRRCRWSLLGHSPLRPRAFTAAGVRSATAPLFGSCALAAAGGASSAAPLFCNAFTTAHGRSLQEGRRIRCCLLLLQLVLPSPRLLPLGAVTPEPMRAGARPLSSEAEPQVEVLGAGTAPEGDHQSGLRQ